MDPVHISQLLEATRGESAGAGSDFSFTRVCIDSRELKKGDVFWAIKGATHDGHQFVSDVIKKGAVACVVERRKAKGIKGPLVLVDDTLAALGDFARWYRHQHESLLIGVTGSVGKTTTREMIYAVLSERHSGIQSIKNYNNEVGVPLSLLQLKADDEFGVFEMGAARVGDIRALCEVACPEVGVITKIAPAHLASFGSLDQVFQGKGELLDALPPHGFAVIGGDDERMRQLQSRAQCNTIFVGEKPDNQIRATEIDVQPKKLRFTVDRRKYDVPVTGRQYLTAALCAIAVAREIGMEAGAIAAGFQNFKGQPGRSQVVQVGPWTIIDDTYNASPASMQAACVCLAELHSKSQKLFIAGDMLELGKEAARLHGELGNEIAQHKFDHVLLFGDHAEEVARGAIARGMASQQIGCFQELDALFAILDCWLERGDTVLVKGSRSMQMERVVEWIKQRHHQEKQEKKQPARAGTRAVA